MAGTPQYIECVRQSGGDMFHNRLCPVYAEGGTRGSRPGEAEMVAARLLNQSIASGAGSGDVLRGVAGPMYANGEICGARTDSKSAAFVNNGARIGGGATTAWHCGAAGEDSCGIGGGGVVDHPFACDASRLAVSDCPFHSQQVGEHDTEVNALPNDSRVLDACSRMRALLQTLNLLHFRSHACEVRTQHVFETMLVLQAQAYHARPSNTAVTLESPLPHQVSEESLDVYHVRIKSLENGIKQMVKMVQVEHGDAMLHVQHAIHVLESQRNSFQSTQT